jgi:LmbE family N-acetylglucosaminyl deacetylase
MDCVMAGNASALAAVLSAAICAFGCQAFAASDNLQDGRTVVIAAHGDDEIIFMEPFLANAMQILWVGHAFEKSRKEATDHIFQKNKVYGGRRIGVRYAFLHVPDQTRKDEANNVCYRDLVTYSPGKTDTAVWGFLDGAKRSGATRVVTHNPWGEYGHPHHRLLNAVVTRHAKALGLDVWQPAAVYPGGGKDPELQATFLDGVTYSQSYSWSRSYLRAREVYITKRATVAPYWSMWTWKTDNTDYAAKGRMFWKTPTVISPALAAQIKKIMGKVPYAAGDPLSQYFVPAFYACAGPYKHPVYYPH